MAGLARRLAPAAALGGLALVIVGVADPALAGHDRTDGGTAAQPATSGSAVTSTSATTAPTDATTTATAPTAASTAATTCDHADSVTGDSVLTRWGPVQVSATVAGGQVCSVQAVQWPTADGRSQMINSYAIPQLDASASQSGIAFDYVSGATYTSEGYHESLQSLLDAL